MKKSFKIFSALILSSTMAFGLGATIFASANKNIQPVEAATHTANYDLYTYSGSYYSSITSSLTEGTSGTLRTTLTNLICPTSWYTYSGDGAGTLSEQLQEADEDPTNSSNMIMLYTRNSVTKCVSNGAANWNREHVWPQSISSTSSTQNWGKTKAGTDLLHLRPTYSAPNSTRGNLKYGNVTGASAEKYNNMEYGYKNSNYFMPLDSVKGDVARICMYVWVAYKNTYSTLPDLTGVFESFDTLMSWHCADKPDVMEGNRNDYVQTTKQKNRNPFVDHPEYAWKIFGSQCSSSVLATAKSTYPENGSSSSNPSASITGTTTVTVGNTTTLTASLSNVSNADNITWTSSNESIATVTKGTTTTSSSVATVEGVAAGSATIYCKHSGTTIGQTTITVNSSGGTIVEGDTEAIDLAAQSFVNQAEVSEVKGTNCSAVFAKGSGSNPPKYYDSGTSVRAYAGNTVTISSTTKTIVKIEFTFGSGGDSNTITSSPATYSNGTWTGSADSVTFTIGGTSGHRRIQSIKVTYQESSSSTTPTVNSVTVSPSTLSLNVNGTSTLNATVSVSGGAAQTVTWASDNTSVVTVDNTGKVTAVAAGTATITATSTIDTSKKGTCTVTVTSGSTTQPQHAGTQEDPYTTADAKLVMDNTGSGVVYQTEVYVSMVPTSSSYDSTYSQYTCVDSNMTISSASLSFTPNGTYTNTDALVGKTVVAKGYIELYNGVYQMGYLPVSVSPTGSKYNPTIVSITPDTSGSGGSGSGDNTPESSYTFTSNTTGYNASPVFKNVTNGFDEYVFNVTYQSNVRVGGTASGGSGSVGGNTDYMFYPTNENSASLTIALNNIDYIVSKVSIQGCKNAEAEAPVMTCGNVSKTVIDLSSKGTYNYYPLDSQFTIEVSTNRVFVSSITLTIIPATDEHLGWGTSFLEMTATECATGQGISSETWSDCETIFNNNVDLNTQADILGYTANASGDACAEAVARYDNIIANYNLTDFAVRGNGANRMNLFKGTSTNNILLILGSISLLGGLTYLAYFLKKRKED